MSRQEIKTEYGVIYVSSPGPYNKYSNVNTLKRNKGKAALPGFVYTEDAGDIVLQGPALRSFREAERRATPRRLRKKGKIKPIRITGVGYRDYDTQRQLWLSDPGRFANPDSSMHVEALAVDIDQGQSAARRYRIRKALLLENWHYGVSGEPWHTSFTVTG
jgi:hypothetical protein